MSLLRSTFLLLACLALAACSDAEEPAADAAMTAADMAGAPYAGSDDSGRDLPAPDLAKQQDTGAGPKLSLAVKHGCYGWPGAAFSPTNKAPWAAQLKAGDTAVELKLKDTTGKSYSLSGLLATRPVWLQLGAFT